MESSDNQISSTKLSNSGKQLFRKALTEQQVKQHLQIQQQLQNNLPPRLSIPDPPSSTPSFSSSSPLSNSMIPPPPPISHSFFGIRFRST